MKRAQLITGLLLLLALSCPAAAGDTQTASLTNGTVTLTNAQANSAWAPLAVMFKYTAASSGTAEVRRVSQGLDVVIGHAAFTSVSSLVWIPPAQYVFGYGDALVITSTATNGQVQVTRRGD